MADLKEIQLNKIKPESFGDFEMVLDEFLPHLSLNSDQVPELFNWEVDGQYRLIIDIVQNNKDKDPLNKVRSSFTIIGYKVVEDTPIEKMTDKEFGEHQGKVLSQVSKQNESSLSRPVNLERR